MKRVLFLILLGSICLAPIAGSRAQPTTDSAVVRTANLDAEVMGFLGRELALHLADIKTALLELGRLTGADARALPRERRKSCEAHARTVSSLRAFSVQKSLINCSRSSLSSAKHTRCAAVKSTVRQ